MNNGHSHVLLIEDNPGDADLVRLRLIEGDPAAEVECVTRLADGLASMAKLQPSVVLLDLNLPDSRGEDTFHKVLEKAPGVPVVILSGVPREHLGNVGAAAILRKPFDNDQLITAIRALC